jgi:hypothetical protein
MRVNNDDWKDVDGYYKNGLTDLHENIHPTYDIFILNVEKCGTKS